MRASGDLKRIARFLRGVTAPAASDFPVTFTDTRARRTRRSRRRGRRVEECRWDCEFTARCNRERLGLVSLILRVCDESARGWKKMAAHLSLGCDATPKRRRIIKRFTEVGRGTTAAVARTSESSHANLSDALESHRFPDERRWTNVYERYRMELKKHRWWEFNLSDYAISLHGITLLWKSECVTYWDEETWQLHPEN